MNNLIASVKNLFVPQKDEMVLDDPLSDREKLEKVRKRSRELEDELLIKKQIHDKVIQLEQMSYMRKEMDQHSISVNITYPLYPPYSFVNIHFDKTEGELSYFIKEPRLKEGEQEKLDTIRDKIQATMDREEIPLNDSTIFGKSEELKEYLRRLFNKVVDLYSIELTDKRKHILYYFVERELLGWGRNDGLLRDPFIEDISCNGPRTPMYVYHRVFGSMKTNIVFKGDMELNRYVIKLAQIAGKHVSVYQPILDATLSDGSRINLTLGSEVTRKGSTFTIRKFSHDPISPIDLLRFGSVSADELAYFWMLVEKHKSILISGGTASGKTTLMNAICMFVKQEDKIVSIEDTPEIHIDHANWIQSVARAGFGAGSSKDGSQAGSISLYDLLAAALRQRPEYVLVGEVRGKEAFTLFQAISVGHAAMATIHAGSINELLHRVENEPMNIPRVLFQSLDTVVFQAQVRVKGKRARRIQSVVEILDVEKESLNLITNNVFQWEPKKDDFEYKGRSYILEEIARSTGISMEDLQEDLKRKEKFIKLLDKKNITYYKDVGNAISEYYIDPVKAILSVEQK